MNNSESMSPSGTAGRAQAIAGASIVIPCLPTSTIRGANCAILAWWVHDHLPYFARCGFPPSLAAFNLTWRTRAAAQHFQAISRRGGMLLRGGQSPSEPLRSAVHVYRGFSDLAWHSPPIHVKVRRSSSVPKVAANL